MLKIDKSFVLGIADLSDAAAIVHTLVQLGKVLGLEIIAEGVENDEQRMRLKAEKIDIAQGFLFARPLDVEALDRFLEQPGVAPVAVLSPNLNRATWSGSRKSRCRSRA